MGLVSRGFFCLFQLNISISDNAKHDIIPVPTMMVISDAVSLLIRFKNYSCFCIHNFPEQKKMLVIKYFWKECTWIEGDGLKRVRTCSTWERSSVELGTKVICWANVVMIRAVGMGSVRMDKHLLSVGRSQLIFQHPQCNIFRKKKIVVHTYLSLNNPGGKEHQSVYSNLLLKTEPSLTLKKKGNKMRTLDKRKSLNLNCTQFCH